MSASRFVPNILLLAIAGCSIYGHDLLKLDPSPRAPTSPDSVRVLAQEPRQTYKVVAILSVTSNELAPGGLVRLTEQLKKKAAELGANGLLIGAEPLSDTKNTQRMTGRAIAFDSVAPPVVPTGKAGRASAIPQILGWALLGAGTVAMIVAIAQGEELTPPTLP